MRQTKRRKQSRSRKSIWIISYPQASFRVRLFILLIDMLEKRGRGVFMLKVSAKEKRDMSKSKKRKDTLQTDPSGGLSAIVPTK